MWRKLSPLILTGAGLLAYCNTFRVPFIFDDLNAITNNAHIRTLWPPWEAMITPAQTPVAGRPVVSLSLALNHAVSGLQPWSYHAFNLALHIANALLLLGIVRRTVRGERTDGTALAVALIWLVHPLLTGSVTYVVQRTELLMALFFLLTLYCMIRGWEFGAVVASALGMGSKEVMAMAPLVVLLYDRMFLAGSFREALRQRWRLYAALGATWLVLVASIGGGARSTTVGIGFERITPLRYALTQCGVIAHYLRLAVWPRPLALDYDDWPIAQSVADVWPAVGLVVALVAVTLWALWRKQRWGFLSAAFLLILSPTSSFVPIVSEVAAEQRMYLPLAVVVATIVFGVRVLVKDPLRRGVLVAVAVVGFGSMTVRRNGDYVSDLAIWSDTVAKRPNNARAQMSFGVALLERGKVDEASAHLREAVRLKPGYGAAHDDLGAALAKQDRLAEAIAEFREALRCEPNNARAHYNLGLALVKEGDPAGAVPQFAEAVRLEPDFARASKQLASALAQLGRTNETTRPLKERSP
ncbi:MAG: tetratricopeptide repeat protein [Verrucomicrobiia bacterium]